MFFFSGTAALETGKKKKRIAPRRIVDSEREVEELEEYTSRTCSQGILNVLQYRFACLEIS